MSSLPADRARSRLESLSTSGLDVHTFSTAAVEVLRQALPFTAACLAPADPATELVTGTVKWGGLGNEQDDEWAFWEYESDDQWNFQSTVDRPGGVSSTHTETNGHPEESARHREFFKPNYDFDDEMRVALRVDGATWGFCAFFRDGRTSAFTPAEMSFVSSVAPLFARGFRAGLVVGAVTSVEVGVGPAVIVVDGVDNVVQASVGAPARIAELGGGPVGEARLPFALRTLIGSARAFALGRHDRLPRMRLRTRAGGWLIAHASPLMSPDGTSTNIVVTIEEARPPDVIPLVVAAYGLTPREQAVVQLVLQGVSTSQIAAALHLSAYTVQDHLKSIFEKAGVRSRRQLTAQVFFDQYAPRLAEGASATPSGWFAPTP
ncbi:helix-turn-helix transcriptional regulator [Aldersonia sp. NBC_00410]|uniref:helix-turn-helix transcriptional regulator n=1 Tax=Aldersonia sp. NBC_00410 TaxID=2975954 RepID=UPI00224CCE37|nr:helix-turn-helix transcriptional regulator [Aldersonia sp. NBC_00410]MCX5044422.1 helix-turn-helix transcriptional regulator [Aldersonia sp. NBC_00410]